MIKKKSTSFFIIIAMIGIFAILVGFAKTFIIPIITGSKTWPVSIYLHATFVFGWVLLFLTQSVLVQTKRTNLHMRIGKLGLFIAIGAAISILPAAMYQCERELKEGLGETAISAVLGSVNSSLIFLSLVILAIANRKKPAAHKRLMLLATIVILWPAWFRWRHYFPSVSRPDIWFSVVLADSLIIVAFIWDWLKHKKIHPALFFAGLFIITENCMEIILFGSSGWRMIANTVYNLLT